MLLVLGVLFFPSKISFLQALILLDPGSCLSLQRFFFLKVLSVSYPLAKALNRPKRFPRLPPFKKQRGPYFPTRTFSLLPGACVARDPFPGLFFSLRHWRSLTQSLFRISVPFVERTPFPRPPPPHRTQNPYRFRMP